MLRLPESGLIIYLLYVVNWYLTHFLNIESVRAIFLLSKILISSSYFENIKLKILYKL